MKNFGLNIKLIESEPRKIGQLRERDYSIQAKRDFAYYKGKPLPKPKPRKKRKLKAKPKTKFYYCKTFLCNWEGSEKDLTRNGCPCCGSQVFIR